MANKPEATFRLGNISASVFVQETAANGQPKREFRTVNVQRSYQDGEKKTKFATNFAMSDLPSAIRCMQLAQNHIEAKEATVAS